MSEKKIESRRAFFKKAGKAIGGAAVTAALVATGLAVSSQETEAKEKTAPKGQMGCDCSGGCRGECWSGCIGGCKSSCTNWATG